MHHYQLPHSSRLSFSLRIHLQPFLPPTLVHGRSAAHRTVHGCGRKGEKILEQFPHCLPSFIKSPRQSQMSVASFFIPTGDGKLASAGELPSFSIVAAPLPFPAASERRPVRIYDHRLHAGSLLEPWGPRGRSARGGHPNAYCQGLAPFEGRIKRYQLFNCRGLRLWPLI